ncbi:UDP-N-acetylmuramoyl-tripeptide--D-alanyl-D-alanine ligase [Roseococcus sp. SDR]|uniref:UDP-N-acetylmuramoyl-tripeptide--D-alanyl-D- alanine ligase n=1 Tax=Roseococcus sp. SDR TaxID=2835532 RepID=UPI001BCDE8E4|nr:UDP-N-acetylmuramoyl-tripeptide--D-alanyl-D-alanine ligase [Roseococcus sp. SDR]MBS7793096.1 UDP-N-acetylmuramoyl-tripeptide--D-alanyl-D-alanine ligase [Roseococcus sp. SDR]MBV1848410.1 UDP-N-acetylmuramoyl-tripeptide--D-alanyl-D-alanine ligase [Roseococcus sp. SDR]
MTPLWTAGELREATEGSCADELAVTGVSIDTRTVQPGDLFVALRDARDGHDFVEQAFARGASAMVDRDMPGPVLRVADTLAGLTALGAAGRARMEGRVIAVTGSVGKTTTKEMLKRALGALGPAHASVASYNNQWGVPLTLARMPRGTEWAAIEIGMNHRHEIAPLSRLTRPHVVIVTAIGTAHIGHLGSQEAIADEKAEIAAGIEPGGIAILPQDSPFFARMAAVAESCGATVVGFGESPEASARMLNWRGIDSASEAEFALSGRHVTVRLEQPGKHMALNALAALAAIQAAGGDTGLAAAALSGFGAGAGRGEMRRIATPDGGTALLLDESYNASDSAIRAALAVLAAQKAKRRIAVLGDMRELGEFGPDLHRALAPDAARAAELVFACGPLMRHLFDALPASAQGIHTEDAASLAPLAAAALRDGDAVLVKGSLGMRMVQIIAALTGSQVGGSKRNDS